MCSHSDTFSFSHFYFFLPGAVSLSGTGSVHFAFIQTGEPFARAHAYGNATTTVFLTLVFTTSPGIVIFPRDFHLRAYFEIITLRIERVGVRRLLSNCGAQKRNTKNVHAGISGVFHAGRCFDAAALAMRAGHNWMGMMGTK